MILVGNKIDRTADRVVSTEEGRNAAKTWNVPFVEVSAMDLDVRFSFLETRQHKQRIFFFVFQGREENVRTNYSCNGKYRFA